MSNVVCRLAAFLFEQFQARGSTPPPFGLEHGQRRETGTLIVDNAVWYNHLGQRLGQGDLSADDCTRIAREMHQDDFFVILRQRLALKDGVRPPKSDFERVDSKFLQSSLPQDYLAKHAAYVVCKDRLYIVDPAGGRAAFKRNGLAFKPIAPTVLVAKFRAFTDPVS